MRLVPAGRSPNLSSDRWPLCDQYDGWTTPVGSARGSPRGTSIQLPELILELTQHVQDSAGINHVVRVLGRERIDGTWEAWLEFVAVGAAIVLTTRVETTQSNREAVAYWATGLEPAYLQGAFARAQRESATRTT